MDSRELQDIFFKIISSELDQTELDGSVKEALTPKAVQSLYALAKHHDLAHIIASSVKRNHISISAEQKEKLEREEFLAYYRFLRMKSALDKICLAFDEAKIPYIPLKGAVIRSYYPEESMRTSCDVDVLIKEEQLDLAVSTLVSKGFTAGEKAYHDISMFSPANVHLELHFSIKENIDSLDSVLKDAWDHVKPLEGSRYDFTNEFFLFYMLSHTAYHLLSGGCGIKPLMDIWVMKNKMNITYEDSRELLERAGLYRFAEEIFKLTDICFSNKPGDEQTDILLAYIIDGGVYGTSENKAAVNKEKNKSTFSYVMKRLFPPYKSMVALFPVLKKASVLLPFCWIIRIFKMIFSGKIKKSVSEIQSVSDIPDERIEEVKRIKSKLGLKLINL